MIIITFDDAVNDENWSLYQDKLFPETYKNPNGCPIHGTFYVSHQYSNYAMVQKLWNQGHEIAVHSISHRGKIMDFKEKGCFDIEKLSNIVHSNLNLSFFKINSCLRTNLCKTEE